MRRLREILRLAPLRAALDKRVLWTLSLIDDRLGRRPQTLHDRIDDLDVRGRQALAALGWHDRPGDRGAPVAELDAARAEYLNWTSGPDGFAAQAGLWFNPPVPVEHRAGEVGVLLVNERIVEHPFVFASVGGEPQRIVDVGGAEGTVGLSLASLGHDVTVVDPRGLALEHPNLHVRARRVQDVHEGGFDVAVVLSAVEHFGLAQYGVDGSDAREDLAALAHVRDVLLRPGGLLVLTVPFSDRAGVTPLERVYDAAGLDALLAGFELRERRVVWRHGVREWRPEPSDAPGPGRGVALVSAVAKQRQSSQP